MPRHTRTITWLAVGSMILCAGAATVVAECEVAKLNAGDGHPGANFGYAVSVSGDYAVMGAPFDEHAGEDSGAAYVFRRDDNGTPGDSSDDTWIEQAKLTASDAAEYNRFGVTVAIGGDHVVVGAPTDTDEQATPGAAYIFRRDDNGTPANPDDDTPVEQAILNPAGGDARDQFGKSVAISGEYVAVGAIGDDHACPSDPNCDVGAAYVFWRNDNGTPTEPGDDVWIQQAKLFAENAWRGADLGVAVAINDNWVLAGASEHNPGGQVHAFRRVDNGTPGDPSDDTWVEHAALTASDAELSDRFGNSLSLSGDYALIGAVWDDDGGSRSGSVYVFRRHDNDTPEILSDDTWIEEAKLTAGDAAEGDWFGFRVSIDGNHALVGALFDDDVGESTGAAYLFQRDDAGTPNKPEDDVWIEESKILASDAGQSDHFGVSVSLAGPYGLIGAHGDDVLGNGSGSAYVFRFFGLPDCNANGISDACDIAGGTSSDNNANGIPDECEPPTVTPGVRKRVGPTRTSEPQPRLP